MGNLIGQEEELTASLQGDYQTQSHPFLLHRQSQQLCLLHKITTNSDPDSHNVRQTVEEYGRSRCASISTLRDWHHLDKKGYCSDEETYYLIFQGQNNHTLKDQITKRRFYQLPFNQHQIRTCIEALLCGLREYSQRFQRDYHHLSLDSLIVDIPTKRVYLRDPWLGHQPQSQNSQKMSKILETYPSPQKLNSMLSPRLSSFNEFHSNLFSVGVIALELKRLHFADSIYSNKKEINHEEIAKRIGQFRDDKLRRGVQTLLSVDSKARKEIFTLWGVENREEHFLAPVSQDQSPRDTSRENTREVVHRQTRQSQAQLHTQVEPTHANLSRPVERQPSSRDMTQSTRVVFNHSQPVQSVKRPHPQVQPVSRQKSQTMTQSKMEPPMLSSRHQGESRPIIVFSKPNTQFHNRNLSSLSPAPHAEVERSPFQKNPDPYRTHVADSYRPNPRPQSKEEPRQLQVSFPKDVVQSKPIEPHSVRPQPSSLKDDNKGNFLSFKDYFNKANPQQNHLTQAKKEPVLPQKEVHHEKREGSSSPAYKESYTFYQKSLSLGEHDRKESQQTITESPVREKPSPIDLVAKRDKEESLEPKPKETLSSPSKEDRQIIRSSVPQKEAAERDSEKEEDFLIREQSGDKVEEKVSTPNRKPSRKKFNSTIVEVHDEETPEHSNNSEEAEGEFLVEEYETGSRYEGFKSGGMRNGQGKFYYQDGGHYEGHWKNNKMDGYGKLYYEGGKLAYEGNWAQDEFDGIGKVYNDNPVNLEGSFDYTNFDYLEDYWDYYEGMLAKDSKEGRGRIRLSNGEVFEGDFHQDKIQGVGKFHSLEGKVVEGMWRDSKLVKVIRSD